MDLAVRLSYAANLAWQVAWHALLPRPMGSQLPWLALLALAPLLLPLAGVMRLQPRSITWASYLLLLYFVAGVTEAWSNPPQRLAALVQIVLACSCIALMDTFSHRQAQG
jgi:uncharacterized membrane protein